MMSIFERQFKLRVYFGTRVRARRHCPCGRLTECTTVCCREDHADGRRGRAGEPGPRPAAGGGGDGRQGAGHARQPRYYVGGAAVLCFTHTLTII